MIRGPPFSRPTGRECRSQRERSNFDASSLEQCVRRSVQGTARRQYIVDQPYACRCTESGSHTKRFANILAPGATDELGLGSRVPASCEHIRRAGNVEPACDSVCDWIDVIEAAMALASWMEWNAHDQIRAFPRFHCDPPREHRCQMVDCEANWNGRAERATGVLESRNPSSQKAFISGECGAGVECASLDEATPAPLERRVFVMIGGKNSALQGAPAAWTAVHSAPPGQNPMTANA
jgi:hypothetical protein